MELFSYVKTKVYLCVLYSIGNKSEVKYLILVLIVLFPHVIFSILGKVSSSYCKTASFLARQTKYASRTSSHISYSSLLQSELLNEHLG